jgi:hypothetical protein
MERSEAYYRAQPRSTKLARCNIDRKTAGGTPEVFAKLGCERRAVARSLLFSKLDFIGMISP